MALRNAFQAATYIFLLNCCYVLAVQEFLSSATDPSFLASFGDFKAKSRQDFNVIGECVKIYSNGSGLLFRNINAGTEYSLNLGQCLVYARDVLGVSPDVWQSGTVVVHNILEHIYHPVDMFIILSICDNIGVSKLDLQIEDASLSSAFSHALSLTKKPISITHSQSLQLSSIQDLIKSAQCVKIKFGCDLAERPSIEIFSAEGESDIDVSVIVSDSSHICTFFSELSNNDVVHDLSLYGDVIENTENFKASFSSFLEKNLTLKGLNINFTSLPSPVLIDAAAALQENKSLESLTISLKVMDEPDQVINAFVGLLSYNSNIKELQMEPLDQDYKMKLKKALESNK